MVGIIKFLPENHPKSDAKMIYKFHEDKIIMSCVHAGKNNRWKDKILNAQNQPTPLTIPACLKLNEKFGEVIGLYYGDGTKKHILILPSGYIPTAYTTVYLRKPTSLDYDLNTESEINYPFDIINLALKLIVEGSLAFKAE